MRSFRAAWSGKGSVGRISFPTDATQLSRTARIAAWFRPGQPGAMQARAPSAIAWTRDPAIRRQAVLDDGRVHLAKLKQRLGQNAAAEGVGALRDHATQRRNRIPVGV